MADSPLDLDKAQCNCGVVGVYNHPRAAVMAYYCLHSLQHRGQEAAGIVSRRFDESKAKHRFRMHKGPGLVADVFADDKILEEHLEGSVAIAHNRYSTTGGSSKRVNIQPFTIRYRLGNLALAHNGNLTNTRELRQKLQNEGAIFQSSTDSELFLHLIARSRQETQIEQIREALRTARGAYSMSIMTDTMLVGARDPHGIRPLSIGRQKRDKGEWAYFIASETCAFDIVGAEYVREVRHNEIVVIDDDTAKTGNIKSYDIDDETPCARQCVFEYIYFSRPDSKIFGHNVDKVRRKLGKTLAEEHPVEADADDRKVISIGVPDSGNTSALGYAHRSSSLGNKVRYEIGLIRSHYVGRTFIAPGQDAREFKVKTKFNPVEGVLKDRKVVVVDDSIVRGTTSRLLLDMMRNAGAKELHMRVSSPPVTHPCKYGMDFPSKEELIANHYDCDEVQIGKALTADSLRYLSVEKLMESVPQEDGIGYCDACFTGNYPIKIDMSAVKTTIADEDQVETYADTESGI